MKVTCQPDHQERTKRGDCAVCARIRAKRWRLDNLERAKIRCEEWRAVNRERDLENKKRWGRENRAKATERQRETRDPEKQRIYIRDWYQNNKGRVAEKTRLWRENNREKHRVQRRNRRARIKAATGSHSADDIADILLRQGSKCAYCRVRLTVGNRHADHIVPIVLGGSNDRSNIQMLCVECNVRKQAIHPVEFARRIGRLI